MGKELYTYLAPETAVNATAGDLDGCRVCIQPALSVRGWPTDAGSLALKGYVALEDAFVVERLREHGARLAASVRMSELGFGLAGDTTGRAVEEDCSAGLVTDAFGESRVIASGHGLAGFKPSQGVVSRRGLIGLIPSMETIAVVAGEASTLYSVLRATVAPDSRDFSMVHSGLPDFSAPCSPEKAMKTVGVIADAVDGLDETEKKTFLGHLERLVQKGFVVKDLSLPGYPLIRKVHQAVGSVEASSGTGKFDSVRYGHRAKGAANWNEMYLRSRAESFGTLLKSYLFQGAYLQFNDFEAYQAACRLRHRLVNDANALFAQVDVLALPVRRRGMDPAAAGTVEEIYDVFEMTLLANLLGTPAVSLPGPVDSDSIDPGLQLLAPRMHDRELMEMAAALMG